MPRPTLLPFLFAPTSGGRSAGARDRGARLASPPVPKENAAASCFGTDYADPRRTEWIVKIQPVLKNARLDVLVKACVFCATLGLSVYLFTVIPKGFFPQQDIGLITGIAE